MPSRTLRLILLQDQFAICQLDASSAIPEWALEQEWFSITRTPDELSILCAQQYVPRQVKSETEWRALQVRGSFAFTEIGVMDSLTDPLAQAGISLLAISTFDTDYIFVQGEHLDRAVTTLKSAGHQIERT